MDKGDERYNNPKVFTLFRKFGYEVLHTGANSSFQDGPVEQAHCTVSQEIKSLLISAGCDIKF